MLGPQPLEHLHEASPWRVEVTLGTRARNPAAAEHQRVEVPRHPQHGKTRSLIGVEREAAQIGLVEVAMSHAHRLADVTAHDLQRAGVIVGVQQRHLAADQLRMLTRPTDPAQRRHLRLHLRHGVVAVGAHALRLLGVIARGTREVAPRKHAVGSLTPDTAAPQELRVGAHTDGQLSPAPRQRRLRIGVNRSRRAPRAHQPGP